jgi:hypothetical protein
MAINNEELLKELMSKIPQNDRFNWAMVYSKRAIYGVDDISEEEWRTWTEANPLNGLTSKENDAEIHATSNKYIPIKRVNKR